MEMPSEYIKKIRTTNGDIPLRDEETNSELVDVRVGADGTTYDSAGEAVRDQGSKLNTLINIMPDDVKDYNTPFSLDLRLGICNQYGEITEGGTEIRRITNYIKISECPYVGFPEEYQNNRGVWIRYFDESKTFKTTTAFISLEEKYELNYNYSYAIVMVACTDPEGGSLVTRNTTLYGYKKNIDDAKSLDDTYVKKQERIEVTVEMEGGVLTLSGGYIQTTYSQSVRSSYFLKVNPGTDVSASYGGKVVSIFEYNENFEFIKSTNSNFVRLGEETHYIKFRYYSSSGIDDYNAPVIATIYAQNIEFFKNVKTDKDHERFSYGIDDKYYTNGMLKLPNNYSNVGKPVPVIVFVHGSGDFYGLESTEMTSNYNTYYQYLCDNGYAIFDCYGWGNVYLDSNMNTGTSTWGSPTNTKCYLKGIEYILKVFNLDENNIFISCKSLGGIQALSLCYQNGLNIRACGMLAPALNPLHQTFGYSQKERVTLGIDFGFSEDVNNVLNVPGDEFLESEQYKSYILENYSKLSGWNPYWINMLLSPSQKVENSITKKDGQGVDYSDVYKTCQIPIKAWYAMDDININPYAVNNMIIMLQNGGCIAEYRHMPDGTGGHHAVDTDENALKTTGVTTKLDVYYEEIPTAYYELCNYFNSWLV